MSTASIQPSAQSSAERTNRLERASMGRPDDSGSSLIPAVLWAAALLVQPFAATAVYAVDELIVTAQKREQNLQDVPISITVFSEEEIGRRGANDLRDLDHFIPNVVQSGLDSNVDGGVTIRGISSDTRNSGFDSGASMYIDGIYVGRSTAFLQDMADVERFEILRGPQGTLFGKNTIAGAFNVVTRKPGDELYGYGEFQAGNYDLLRGRVSIGGPIVEETLAASISAFAGHHDGYQTNLFDGQDFWNENTQGGRVNLRLRPTDQLDIIASADVFLEDSRMNVFTPSSGLGSDCCIGEPRKVNIDAPVFVDREFWGASLTWNYEFGNGGVLTSISAYRDNEREFLSDDDATSFPILFSNFNDGEQQFTQELRYASPDEDMISYVLGFYYFNQEVISDRFSETGPSGPDCPFCFAPFPLLVMLDGEIDTSAYAFFGQADWDITDALTLTGGLRYTNERRELVAFDLVGIPFLIETLDKSSLVITKIKDGAISWTAGLSYQVTDALNTYVKASRGFKSGGFNADFLPDTTPNVDRIDFEPEFAVTYEGGIKFQGLDDRLRANVAGFFTDYKDLQVSIFNAGAPGFQVKNAGKAEIWGVELDLEAQPFEGLDLFAGIGYQDATFKEFPDAGGPGIDFDGNRMVETPKWGVSVAAQYTWPVFNVGSMYLRGEYAYRGEYFVRESNIPESIVPSYGFGNARLGFDSADEHLTLELWVKNITDNLYINGRDFPVGGLFGQTADVFGPPRTYGVRLVGRL